MNKIRDGRLKALANIIADDSGAEPCLPDKLEIENMAQELLERREKMEQIPYIAEWLHGKLEKENDALRQQNSSREETYQTKYAGFNVYIEKLYQEKLALIENSERLAGEVNNLMLELSDGYENAWSSGNETIKQHAALMSRIKGE